MKYIIEPILSAIVFAFQFIWFLNYKKANAATSEWLYYNTWFEALTKLLTVVLALIGMCCIFDSIFLTTK